MDGWLPRRLTAAQLEGRRLAAAEAFPAVRVGRHSQADVAREIDARGGNRQPTSRTFPVEVVRQHVRTVSLTRVRTCGVRHHANARLLAQVETRVLRSASHPSLDALR